MAELSGRVAVVTGASRGIGRAVALKFAELGAKVAINYLSREAEAVQVAEEVNLRHSEAKLVQADVGDSQQVSVMFQQIISQWEKVDILVNNAGINRDILLLRMSDEAWEEVIRTNLSGAYLCSKFALRPMLRQRWGRIINISSIAALMGNMGQTNYAAAKAGLIGFTKSLAREIASRNITVNAIAPGFITTEMTDKLPSEEKELILSRIPAEHFGQPQDVAEVAAFLASQSANYITGEVIRVDGGVGI
jgi:3-oxoacyl-[acyl-carrier protein] reductase